MDTTLDEYVVIGNDRLAKSLQYLNPNIHAVSSRAIVNNSIDINDLDCSKLIITGQATRRYQDQMDIKKFNSTLLDKIEKVKNKINRLIFISSIDVFGSNALMPLTSTTLTGKSIDNYTQSKLEAEKVIRSWNHCQTIILRSPGLYGCDLEEGSVISRMASSALMDGKIYIYDADITRPFLTYTKCAKTIVELTKRFKDDKYKSVTIGPSVSVRIGEVATQIKEFIESKGFGNNIDIRQNYKDTSGGRDKVITTNWAKECSEIGLGVPEDPVKGIEKSMHVFTCQYAKVKQ